MRIHRTYRIMIAAGLLALFSCSQDPIFFIISTETAPQKPRIEGAPTNMVVFEREYAGVAIPIMYVASGKLHWYAQSADGESRWDLPEYGIPQPEGKIISLAVTRDRLFALSLDDLSVTATLRSIGKTDSAWTTIVNGRADYPRIQSIYADPEQSLLIAGAYKANKDREYCAILYLDTADNTLKMLKEDTSILSGLLWRDGIYYLSTKGDGIFQIDESSFTGSDVVPLAHRSTTESSRNLIFMSMIKLADSTIIAVERTGGWLYTVQDGFFERIYYAGTTDGMATGKYTTGALVVWTDELDENRKMLIAGIQGGLYSSSSSSYTHGYVEFDLYANGSLNTTVTRRDTNKLQSVHDTDRYTATIGKHPITHLFQTPPDIDAQRVFFASTQTSGLWSYRDRPDNDGWQWNAEE